MPNGLHLSDSDFYAAMITAKQYLAGLESYLERMLAFGAIDEDSARRWFTQALTTLGYKDYATYVARVETDTRTINPSVVAGEITPAMVMPGLQAPSPRALPYFKQVVAPIVYRGEADRLALQYGHIDAEGNVVNEAAYNTLLRNAIQDAENYKYEFIQENLQYLQDTAEATGDMAKVRRYAANIEEVGRAIHREAQKGLAEAQRAEAWAEQQRAGEQVRRERLGERAAAETRVEEEAALMRGETVRGFLEEDRPAGMQEFIRGELPGVLEKFEREQAGARRAWWGEIDRPSYEARLREAEFEEQRWAKVRTEGLKAGLGVELKLREAELRRPLTQQDMTPEEYYFTIAQRKRQEYQASAQALRGYTPEQMARMDRPREEPEDPLKAYLAQYPWSAEFMKLAPSQRGFYPSRFAPSARWFVNA